LQYRNSSGLDSVALSMSQLEHCGSYTHITTVWASQK
jgi:hypothetical protein